MNNIVELFGNAATKPDLDWRQIVVAQACPYTNRRCYKVRKSDPDVSIGTCAVLYGRASQPLIICPARLLERRQIFTDCLHLLTTHQPGNELHIVSEVSVPGGSVDYFLVSAKEGRVKDFVGVEIQTLDTTGTVWPERQRLLKQFDVPRSDAAEASTKPYGINWKMTAKTILVQMHHKIQTFEHVNKKLALVIQSNLLDYMSREFNFSHLSNPPSLGDSLHFHAYQMSRQADSLYKIGLGSRLSTDAAGMAICLGLQAEARVELDTIMEALQAKLSDTTLFSPLSIQSANPLLPPIVGDQPLE